MLVTRALRMDPMTPATALLIFLPPLLCALASPRPQSLAASLAIVLVAGTIWDRADALNEHIDATSSACSGSSSAAAAASAPSSTATRSTARRRSIRRGGGSRSCYARSGPGRDVAVREARRREPRRPAVRPGRRDDGGVCVRKPALGLLRINPSVERIAADPRYFTYLADCGRSCEVVAGDARLTLARSPGSFDVIVLDAFNSDAIPVHLLTREALALYRRLLAPGGVILVHCPIGSSTPPVVAALADDAGLVGMQRTDMDVDLAAMAAGKFDSCWAVLAGSRDDLKGVATNPDWSPLQRARGLACGPTTSRTSSRCC